ncbi:MAG TPA: hypothetical protein VK927_04235, partial [Adhaeribacter sp.]|nr:hypothetical protein [Adhaeribacter sp.]
YKSTFRVPILLVCLLGFPGFSVRAETDFTKPVEQAYQEILKLRVNRGRQLLEQELQHKPLNPAALLVANYADFLSVLVSQDEKVYQQMRARQEKRLELLNGVSDKSPYKKYGQAEIKLQLAMGQIFFADEVKAAWNVRSAFLLLQQNQKQFPHFIPNRKSLGLLQVIIGSVPDSYQWVFKILGMRGDIKTGLANLELAARTPNPFQKEAIIYQEFAHDWMNRKDNSGPRLLGKLARENPDNLLFTYLAMSMMKKNKQCDAALTLFLNRPHDARYLDFPYLHHLAADMFLYKGEYERSVRENRLFLAHYKGRHYLKDANFKLYLASLLLSDPFMAQYYYSNLKAGGLALVEEDKYAQKFAESGESVNLQLVEARLHADGGYYKEALQALRNFKTGPGTAPKDNLEYLYRMARIYQGLDQPDSAAGYYQKTIVAAGNQPYYFAPNAALQLGYLALERNDKTAAKNYFKKALSYPKHEYKNSIDSKAKIALSAL